MKKSWLKWLIVAVVLLGVGAVVAKRLQMRKLERAAATAPAKAPAGFDLSPHDVVVAGSQELARTLAVSGGLKAVNSAFIKAKVSAEVKSLTVREGDTVKAGQLIGQLDTSELVLRLRQAEQTAASSRAQVDIAKRTLENNRALVAQGFISANGLETSVSNAGSAEATYGAATAAVDLARKSLADAHLVAPISGLVSQRLVQVGERVSIDTRIVEVVDLSRIELEAAMAPEDVVDIRVGQTARLQVDGFAAPLPAKVARINPSTQSGTRALMVYLALDPHPGLRQGLFAKGSIELQRRSALVVPTSAVRIDQARPYVLAVVDGKVALKNVTLGARGEVSSASGRESVVELTEGLTPGTTVLRGTVGLLREGTPVNLLPVAATMAAASASR
ncbi:MAG: efflux RND transporter periplasmic adaptor subunit [Cytophagales bacterium]|nr:efflux RND transporter periplasmic adaptor subunit [Rhizobacter sp.]